MRRPEPTPRPPDVTAGRVAAWARRPAAAECVDSIARGNGMLADLFPGWRPPDPRECYHTSLWLEEELADAGADPATAEAVCFAHGQWLWGEDDPWRLAAETLEAWRRGEWDRPGPGLAARIFLKRMAGLGGRYGRPSQSRVLNAVAAHWPPGPLPPVPEDPRASSFT